MVAIAVHTPADTSRRAGAVELEAGARAAYRQSAQQGAPLTSAEIGRRFDPDARRHRCAADRRLTCTHEQADGRSGASVTSPRGLLAENVSFFSIRDGGALVGVGALKRLDDSNAEIKSMHTAEAARGRGVGRTMVDHLLDEAQSRGYRRVSLETGSMAAFAPARALYESAGFKACEPFAEYRPSPNSFYMTLELDRRQQQA